MQRSFDDSNTPSTTPIGEDCLSARFALFDSHRLGARRGVTGELLALRGVAKLWTTPALSAPFCAPERPLRSLFL